MGAKRTVDRERVRELADKGLSARQIAARLGCSDNAVRRILREMEGK